MTFWNQTYCSLGKVYAAPPGGGGARPGTEGYLKMAVACEGAEKVFFDRLLVEPVAVVGIDCGEW